jgi:chromatin remodeling complex protein RSC6
MPSKTATRKTTRTTNAPAKTTTTSKTTRTRKSRKSTSTEKKVSSKTPAKQTTPVVNNESTTTATTTSTSVATSTSTATTTQTTPETKTNAPQNDRFENYTASLESTNAQLDLLFTAAQDGLTRYKDLLTTLKTMRKTLNKERKDVQKIIKASNLKAKRKANRSNGGFTKPVPLSQPLCTFLNVSNDTELPRTEVTRRITAYIKENKLQNESDRKQILPDNTLKTLLFMKDGDVLTYFNLQRYLKYHFLKRDKETGAVSEFAPPS